MALIGIFFVPAIFASFWIGVAGLWQIRKSAAWWLMASSVIFSTLLLAAHLVSLFRMPYFGSATAPEAIAAWNTVTTRLVDASLVFGIGFAMHGLKAAATGRRLKELELLTISLTEEVNELRREARKA